MDQANGEQHLEEGEPLIPDTDGAGDHNEPEEGRPPALFLGPEHDIYACNHCKNYVRGGVITFCGHLFCWTCLWPLLANKPSPKCPYCQTALLLHEDILPFYGEGPNARPEDANVLAEPGAVPRPTGICLNRPLGYEDAFQDWEQDRQMVVPNQLVVGWRRPLLVVQEVDFEEPLPPMEVEFEEPLARIDFTVRCLKWMQQVFIIILCLFWCFQPHN